MQRDICSDCRKRNIRCDGARPQCGACTADILACNYEQAKPHLNVLTKGSACLPCRQAKVKCDAKRPECGPCQKSQSRGPCAYDQPLRRMVNARMAKKPSSADVFGANESHSNETTASLNREPDFSAFPASDVSQNHKNMVFRLISLSHDLVYGNIHPSAKAQAIMLGDISGTIISPFFVYFAELSGRYQYHLSRMEFPLWDVQGALLQLTFQFLLTIRAEDDPFTFAQAHWMVALAMMTIGNPTLAWKHYRRAVTVIRRHDIRFAPRVIVDYPGTPSLTIGFIPSEEDHERVVFLSKIIYLEVFLFFYISGLPGTKVWADRDLEDRLPGCADGIRQDLVEICNQLEPQFRLELPAAYPSLWETCPLILRTRTFLWLKDVKKCLEGPHTSAMGVNPMTRAELVVQGSECLQHIITLAKKYSDTGDRDRCMILRSNALLTITGLLELHRSVFQEGVITTKEELLESKQKCGELLARLANTARQTLEEDGQRIKDLITHDHGRDATTYNTETIISLVSTGGFACTLLPLPSHHMGTIDERFVERFLNSPLQKVVEVNFNLAAKEFWNKFMDASEHATRSSTNYLLHAVLE